MQFHSQDFRKNYYVLTYLTTLVICLWDLTLQGLGFFWLPMVGGVDLTPPPPLAKISDNDAIRLKLGTLIL